MAIRGLIINADDFGWSRSVNEAVAGAHGWGTVTSTSLMTCGPALAQAVEICRENKRLGVGLHFTLTQAGPVAPPSQVRSLCDTSGRFFSRGQLMARLFSGRVRPGHIRTELAAQMALVDKYGLSLTHIDGHQHIHVLPGILGPVLDMAAQRGLAVRIPLEQRLANHGNGPALLRIGQIMRKSLLRPFCRHTRLKCIHDNIRANTHFRSYFGLVPSPEVPSLGTYLRLLEELPAGVTEIMVHPALSGGDPELWGDAPALMGDREAEARILLDPAFKAALHQNDISLINYGDL